MSYSFTVKAASKTEVKAKAATEFERVLQQQPVHAADLGHAATAADTFLGLLDDSQGEGKDVTLSISGSVGWTGDQATPLIGSAGVSINAYYVLRPVA